MGAAPLTRARFEAVYFWGFPFVDAAARNQTFAALQLQASPYVYGIFLPNTKMLDGLVPVLHKEGITEVSMVYAVNDPLTVYDPRGGGSSWGMGLHCGSALLLESTPLLARLHKGISLRRARLTCFLCTRMHALAVISTSCLGSRDSLQAQGISVNFVFGYEARSLVRPPCSFGGTVLLRRLRRDILACVCGGGGIGWGGRARWWWLPGHLSTACRFPYPVPFRVGVSTGARAPAPVVVVFWSLRGTESPSAVRWSRAAAWHLAAGR